MGCPAALSGRAAGPGFRDRAGLCFRAEAGPPERPGPAFRRAGGRQGGGMRRVPGPRARAGGHRDPDLSGGRTGVTGPTGWTCWSARTGW